MMMMILIKLHVYKCYTNFAILIIIYQTLIYIFLNINSFL